jgi:hypothetical protein
MLSHIGVTRMLMMTNAAKKMTLAAIGKEMPPFAMELATAFSPAKRLEMEPSSEKLLVLDPVCAKKLVMH